MKKILVLMMTLLMVLSISACGNSGKAEKTSGDASKKESDTDYVKGKGKLVIGITDYAPMDYLDTDGYWIGFDADMAKAFAKSLGVEAEFIEIDWDNKIMELDGKTIDCVWNGMTLTDEVTSSMACSNAYAVEAGSAGEKEVSNLDLKYTSVKTQADALMEVAAGTSDAAVIDSLMAAAMVGKGTSYANLTYTVELNSEEYGVGFRKGSDLVNALNDFFASSYADGSMQSCAETYGVQAAIINQ